MMTRLPCSLLALLAHTLLATASTTSRAPTKRHYDTHNYYVLEHVTGLVSLEDVSQALGVEIVEQMGELVGHWIVKAEKLKEELSARELEARDPVIEAFDALRARAADPSESSLHARSASDIVSSIPYLSRQLLRQRTKRAPPPIPAPENPSVNDTSDIVASRFGIADPLFGQQWHLVNNEFPRHMMNVSGLWGQGITGKDVITAFVDDGLDYTNEDLAANFYAYGSYDFNDFKDLPYPSHGDDHHGTRCAGQVGAVKNNLCGVGIAFDSLVAGLRILSGPISDADEASSLNYDFQNTSIYSCSWGPPDNGESMEAPGYLIRKSMAHGINHGRGGKGSIFVFASGNGAAKGDQCNFDGYTNSIYSVTVSAVDYKGLHPYYSEPCAANMIVAYSSGSGKSITTSDKGKDACASTHGGTSAAAPNAAGVIALALEVRPDLTWRDIQHLCVETSIKINPDDPDWEPTAQGRPYSYKYGFGSMDGYAYVMKAKDWTLVKPQAWFTTNTVQLDNGTMPENGDHNTMAGGRNITAAGLKSTIIVTQAMMEQGNLEKLEHIQVKVWITHTRRGDVEVEVVSPNGIKSVLGSKRSRDADKTGYPGWIFMSVKHWGENPVGDWTIRVNDQGSEKEHGKFLGWNMVLWGSAIDSSKVTLYQALVHEPAFPPPPLPSTPTTTTTAQPDKTKSHDRPTAALPTDHGTNEGEAHKPAFPGGTQDDVKATPRPSSHPTADEGWFPGMASLVSDRKWFFGALSIVVLFALGAGAFFWRRRRRARRLREYSAIAGDGDLPMTAVGGTFAGRPRTKELYDAFGEVSDDDDDYGDETTGLARMQGSGPGHHSPVGLAFHAGFLDDEDPLSARTPGGFQYRDEPEPAAPGDHPTPEVEGRSTSGATSPSAVSGDSWEHASDTR